MIHHARKCRRAFTLIEILVVVIIIATLAGAVVLTLANKPDEASVARAKADIATIETALETYKLQTRTFPAESDGLAALVKAPDGEDGDRWSGPYIKRLPKDPWNREYMYEFPGSHNEDSFDVYSLGADGLPGGEGFDADIGNWSEEE